jgi:serine/threonine-protein kinase
VVALVVDPESSTRLGSVAVAAPAPAAVGTAIPPPAEPAGLPFHMEAWMPEAIAMMKLRGFVHDCGGEVVESVPGLIRVRLGRGRGMPAGAAGSGSWFGFGRRAAGPLDVELHLYRSDPKQANKLAVKVLFRPGHASLLTDAAWKRRCGSIFVELRAYLMGGLEQ